jgi:hypothetical protein
VSEWVNKLRMSNHSCHASMACNNDAMVREKQLNDLRNDPLCFAWQDKWYPWYIIFSYSRFFSSRVMSTSVHLKYTSFENLTRHCTQEPYRCLKPLKCLSTPSTFLEHTAFTKKYIYICLNKYNAFQEHKWSIIG